MKSNRRFKQSSVKFSPSNVSPHRTHRKSTINFLTERKTEWIKKPSSEFKYGMCNNASS